MALQDIDNHEIDDDMFGRTSDKLPNGHDYFVDKLVTYLEGKGYPPLLWEDSLRKNFQDHFIWEYSNYRELYVLILACIYKLNKDTRKTYDCKNDDMVVEQ